MKIKTEEILHQSVQNKPRKKNSGVCNLWTADEEQILRTNQSLENKMLMELLPNRTLDAITTKKTYLGIKNGNRDALELTEFQKEYINNNHSKKTIGAMAKELGLFWVQVKRHLKSNEKTNFVKDTRIKRVFELFNIEPTTEIIEELRKLLYSKYR